MRKINHTILALHILEWIRIIECFTHVGVLEHGSENVLRQIAESIIVLVYINAWICRTVDEDLQILALLYIEQKEKMLKICNFIFYCILKEDTISDTGRH